MTRPTKRECRHETFIARGQGRPHDPYVEQCFDCRYLRSLGPSNDADPAVALEIRAAELAAEWDPDDGEWHGYLSLGMCSPGAEHGPLIERDIAQGNKSFSPRDLADYYAGHLARCIADHDAEQAGEES